MFDTAGSDIADSSVDGSTTVFGEHNSADAKETGQPKQGTEVLGVLDLVERQPEVASGRAGLQELLDGYGGGRFADSGAGAGTFGFAAWPAAVIERRDGDGGSISAGQRR